MTSKWVPSESLVRIAREARIVKGMVATPGEFPHQVAINYHGSYRCSGSIISTLLVLTAAHCFDPEPGCPFVDIFDLTVVAGLHDINAFGVGEQAQDVKFVYRHENFNSSTFENDIAILVLSEPLKFNVNVTSITLPGQGETFRGRAVVSGWGRIKYRGEASDKLLKITVPIVPTPLCQSAYLGKYMITSGMICMGDGVRDACQGDSGGPAVCTRNDRTKVQCGIVSFGHKCGEKEYPGVYAYVPYYMDWIKNIEKQILSLPRNDEYLNGPGCIPGTILCHLEWHCTGNCNNYTSCRRGEFRCSNGRCIERGATCNDIDDCGDQYAINRSDEVNCTKIREQCAGDQHQCGVGGRCIPKSKVCNGYNDCGDNSDEDNCSLQLRKFSLSDKVELPSCPKIYEFYCVRDFSCIPMNSWCDGQRNCPSSQDELSCPKSQELVQAQIRSLHKKTFCQRLRRESRALRNTSDSIGCLKLGTKILMADQTEKNVENLKTGDMILDINLQPTRVLGVNFQYMKHGRYFGFDEKLQFFTGDHMFVGNQYDPVKGTTSSQLYVVSVPHLLENNPLMKYWDVHEMKAADTLRIVQYNHSTKTTKALIVGLYKDPHIYPPETPVFFINVDSATGTYFANGYACKVDIPQLQKWPYSMGLLSELLKTPSAEYLSNMEYSLTTIESLESLLQIVVTSVERFFTYTDQINASSEEQKFSLMTFTDEDTNKFIGRTFNEPTAALLTVGLYAKVGNLISEALDTESSEKNIARIAQLQNELFKLIKSDFDLFVKNINLVKVNRRTQQV